MFRRQGQHYDTRGGGVKANYKGQLDTEVGILGEGDNMIQAVRDKYLCT